jgi:hypothetical protein
VATVCRAPPRAPCLAVLRTGYLAPLGCNRRPSFNRPEVANLRHGGVVAFIHRSKVANLRHGSKRRRGAPQVGEEIAERLVVEADQ